MEGSSEEENYDKAEAGGSGTHPEQAVSLKRGSVMVIKGRPCKVMETSTSKTGKHGHAKMHIVAIDIFNGKKCEALTSATHNVDIPDIERKDYTLLDIAADGFLTLQTATGTREDLKLPEGELGAQIRADFDNGADLALTVLSALGIEQVSACREEKS
nr:probabletranslation initiation factor 5A-1 [Paratrimastix eleionoma]